jgi:hypothetical protein
MNSPPLKAVKGIEAFPSAQVTAATTGAVFYSYYQRHEPPDDNTYSGWMSRAAVFVDQSAGSGNNGGNYLQVTVQGRHDSTDPWCTLPQSQEIKITENVATGYYAALVGPLLPEMRVNITETGTADATFRIHVFLEA